jgi:hypothetical protein
MSLKTLKSTRNASVTALVLATALLSPAAWAAKSPATTQWIVTSAHATGTGTPPPNFISSLRIVNPNAAIAHVTLTFYKQIALDGSGKALGDNTAAAGVTVDVPANQTLAIDDVIATQFGNAANAGGIKVDSDIGVSVLSQTLNTNVAIQGGATGSDGLAIPGLVQDEAIFVGEPAYIPYISASVDTATGKRSNLFLQSATSSGDTVVHVKLVKGDGTVVGEKDLTLGKLVQTQFNRIAAQFGYSVNDTNLTVIVTVTSGGPVFIGASVNDNAVGSQYFAPATKIATFRNNFDYGLVLNDGGFAFSGRLQIIDGLPDYISMAIVLTNCPPPDNIILYFFQAFASGVNQNTTFTKNPDGSYSFAGNSTSASWSGSFSLNPDGTLYGTVTYARAPGAATCPNGSTTYTFTGAPVAPITGL